MTAADARPPSGTGTTGWHRHGEQNSAWRDGEDRDCEHIAGPSRPVLVADPAEARETLAQHRQEHNPATGASACSCGEWEGPFTMLPGSDGRSFAAHLLAALAGQEHP